MTLTTAAPAIASIAGDSRDSCAVAPPARAAGVELLRELRGSGLRQPPGLVRRGDGQTVQLTPLLYHLLWAIDGRSGEAELAVLLSDAVDRFVTADDVRFLVDTRLRPLGLLRQLDGAEPDVTRSNPLLALRFKAVVSKPAVTRRLTAPFAALFHGPVVAAVLTAFALVAWWVAFEKGLASPAQQALYEPGALLLVVALTIVSAGFHEFGHAAACRYGGATPGAMGFGVYLLWPAFYTDVTDSYRLGRAGRLRVDVGGLYFNAVFAIATFAVWAAVRWDALLLVVGTQLFQMLRQLAPFVRFDGYHILADLIGVPDLFAHIKPTVGGILPTRRRRRERSQLKPWARAVVTVWVVTVVPLLGVALALMVAVLPRVVATGWDSLGLQWRAFFVDWAGGDVSGMAVRFVSVLSICIPMLSMVYLVARVVRRSVRRVQDATAGRPGRRAGALLAGGVVLVAVAWAWWPDDQYPPIGPRDRWTVSDATDAVALPIRAAAARSSEQPSSTPPARAAFPAAQAPPADLVAGDPQPQWVLVLRPRAGPSTSAGPAPEQAAIVIPIDGGSGDAVTLDADQAWMAPTAALADIDATRDEEPTEEARPTWVFPFDPPAPPGEGDNQALAVNTEDGTTVYDVAFALVWVTDGSVEERNEAYALASCRGCRAVAVAFEVVLVVGQTDVAAPANAAVAVNYDCIECATYALARQLVLTLSEMPSDEVMTDLEQLWADLSTFSEHIELLPVDEVQRRLASAEAEIADLLADEGLLMVATTLVGPVGASDGSADATTTTSLPPTSSTSTSAPSTSSSTPSSTPSSPSSSSPSSSSSTSSSSTSSSSTSSSSTSSSSTSSSSTSSSTSSSSSSTTSTSSTSTTVPG